MSGSSSTTSTVCRIRRVSRTAADGDAVFAKSSAPVHGSLAPGWSHPVDVNDRKEGSMRRIPTMMASAGAAALTTLAVSVAGLAIGDEGGTDGAGPRHDTAASLSECLDAHGVADAPTDDALKAWIGARLDAGDATLRAAMEACSPPTEVRPADRAQEERRLRSCLADNGADVPAVGGGDLKRWILAHQRDPATAAALKACHLVIDDHPSTAGCDKAGPAGEGAGTPGDKAAIAKRAKAARS
jgi:hypothetical protein